MPQNNNKAKVIRNANRKNSGNHHTVQARAPTNQLRTSQNIRNARRNGPQQSRNRTISIPRSSKGSPMHVHQEKIHDNLKQKSAWFQSLEDPAQGAGIKMPDDVAVQTGTLQCVQETSFTTSGNPGTLGGLQFTTPYANQAPGAVSGNGINFRTMSSIATPTTIAWNQYQSLDTNDALAAYSEGVRVVSACLCVESEGSLVTSEGLLSIGSTPYFQQVSPNLSSYKSAYGTALMPLNASTPMMVKWFPVNKGNQTYSSFYDPNLTAVGNTEQHVPFWGMFAIVEGVTNPVTFRCRLVVNYEFLPRKNSIDILSANPSPVDATEVDLVESWVAETPNAKPTTTQSMSSSPGAGLLEREELQQDGGPTGFGMFAEVLGEILPYALEGISLLI